MPSLPNYGQPSNDQSTCRTLQDKGLRALNSGKPHALFTRVKRDETARRQTELDVAKSGCFLASIAGFVRSLEYSSAYDQQLERGYGFICELYDECPVRIFARRWLLLATALVVFSGALFASGPNDAKAFSVVVTVIDEKDQPVADAIVEVRVGDKSLNTSATDASGKVNLTLPGVGDYALAISKQGYLNTGTMLEIGADTPLQDMDVVMSSAALSQQSVTVNGEASNPVKRRGLIHGELAFAGDSIEPDCQLAQRDSQPLPVLGNLR